MITAYIGVEGALLVARQRQGRWRTEPHLDAKAIECVAADPLRPERVYCGTRGQGLWRSDDAGASWRASGDGIPYADVTAVGISAVGRAGGDGGVAAGTERRAIFRSEEGGARWLDGSGLTKLPPAAPGSSPPRPWTHHARWIALDPQPTGWLWVCAEAGATVRSSDAGQ